MTAVKKKAGHFMGFDTAAELKAAVMANAVNTATLRGYNSTSLVFDNVNGADFYILARGKTDVLFCILPDSKELVPARRRQNASDLPFIFEVMA